jgi:hypothetical protein
MNLIPRILFQHPVTAPACIVIYTELVTFDQSLLRVVPAHTENVRFEAMMGHISSAVA